MDRWLAATKLNLLGYPPIRRRKGKGVEKSQQMEDYQRRSKQIYDVITRAHKRHSLSVCGQFPTKGKYGKYGKFGGGGGGGSDNDSMDEDEISAAKECGDCDVETEGGTCPQVETERNSQGQTQEGGSFRVIEGSSGADDDGDEDLEREVESGLQEKVDDGVVEDEEEEGGSEEERSEEEKEPGGRPRRVVQEMDRWTYNGTEKDLQNNSSRSCRRGASATKKKPSTSTKTNPGGIAVTPEIAPEKGVLDVDSLQWTLLRNMGVYVDAVCIGGSHQSQLPPLEEDVMKTFGILNTKTANSQCYYQPQSQQNTRFSSCPSMTLRGAPTGGVCRVIRNMNRGVLHVEVFQDSIHIFDTLCVIGCHIVGVPKKDIHVFVSRATETLQPVFARKYNLDHGDIIFVDARMLVRVTENALTSTSTNIVFEQCVVSLFGNKLSGQDLAFNYPDKCSRTDLYLGRNVLVEKALLQYLFPTVNMASAVLSSMSSAHLKSVCKAIDKEVNHSTVLERLEYLDVVGNFVEAEALRRNCLQSMCLDGNPEFKNLSVWHMRILVLACIHAKSTFFAEVFMFDQMSHHMQDAVKHLCRSATPTRTLDVETVKLSELMSFVSTYATASVAGFLEHLQGKEDYVRLEENDKSQLPSDLTTQLAYFCSVAQSPCRCIAHCDENCSNRQASIFCSRECCAVSRASGRGQCGNTIADLPIADVVVRDCDVLSMGKEIAAGQNGFHKDDFVGQYIGELIASNRAMSGRGFCYTIHCDMTSSSSKWPSFVYINAERKGNIYRRANHSHNPNCGLYIWFESDCPIAILVARREILPGEAITFDYQWDGVDGFGESGCLCDSEICPNKDRSKATSLIEKLLTISREKAFKKSTYPLGMVRVDNTTRKQNNLLAAAHEEGMK